MLAALFFATKVVFVAVKLKKRGLKVTLNVKYDFRWLSIQMIWMTFITHFLLHLEISCKSSINQSLWLHEKEPPDYTSKYGEKNVYMNFNLAELSQDNIFVNMSFLKCSYAERTSFPWGGQVNLCCCFFPDSLYDFNPIWIEHICVFLNINYVANYQLFFG